MFIRRVTVGSQGFSQKWRTPEFLRVQGQYPCTLKKLKRDPGGFLSLTQIDRASIGPQTRSRRINLRLTTSTSNKYVTVMPARKRKYRPGNGVKPRYSASGVNGSMMPTSTIRSMVIVSGRLGRLRNGLPVVRITNSTSVCVASD